MTPSTEVAVSQAKALGLSQEEYDALIADQDNEFNDEPLQIPILKIGQPLTKEVQAEEAEAGEFIDSVIGEGLGENIKFIVAYYNLGRFASDKQSGRAYAAGFDIIPEHWEPLVGAAMVGQRFDEHPDAEEQYKERVNNKEIEWGSGPLISTTHNYTGLIVLPGEDENEYRPARLSLKRTDMPAVRKIRSLRTSRMRGRQFFSKVFDFSTEKKAFTKGAAFLLVPKLDRDATEAEQMLALELARYVREGRVRDNLESDSAGDKPVEPQAKGGLGV